jgi:glycogen synthase
MRVLHLTTEFPPIIWGGLGTAVGGLAIASAEAGMSVGVGLPTGTGSLTYSGYRIPRQRGRRVSQTASRPPNVDVFELPSGNPIDAALRLAREWRPDVVHLHSFWLAGVAFALRSVLGVPLVYTVHSLDRAEYDLGQGPAECLDQWHTQRDVIERADRVIALTNAERELVGEYCPGVGGKVRVVGNGIADCGAARRARRRTTPGNPLTVLFTGRFVERKGVRDLLAALPRVLDGRPDVRVVLAGGHRGCSGAEMERYWLPADASPYRSRLLFTGWLTADQLAAWYERADILVVPSWYEPFGMVILEGMLYGIAVAAAAVGGPAEILEQERTGLLFEPKNPGSLGEALGRLIDNATLRQRVARAGALEVRRRWLWPRLIGRVREVYSEAVTSAERERGARPGEDAMRRQRGPRRLRASARSGSRTRERTTTGSHHSGSVRRSARRQLLAVP